MPRQLDIFDDSRDVALRNDLAQAVLDPVTASGADWAWLPAFALIDQPLLAGPLSSAKPSADAATGRAFQAVMALLRLERQGRHHEIVTYRARLKSLSAPLFAAYMSTR